LADSERDGIADNADNCRSPLPMTDNVLAESRQRLRVLEWAVGANTVMLVGLVLKLIVFG